MRRLGVPPALLRAAAACGGDDDGVSVDIPTTTATPAIIDHVEWGVPRHGMSDAAGETRRWVEGGFVEVAAETPGLIVGSFATSGTYGWTAEIGG